MVSWETFQAAYQQASPATKEFLESEQIAGLVDDIGRRTEAAEINRQELLIAISDFILGLVEKKELRKVLEKSLDEAGVEAMLSRISNLSAAGEAALTENSPVAPVRTMESDKAAAQEGQTFASSQEALLNKKRPEQRQ